MDEIAQNKNDVSLLDPLSNPWSFLRGTGISAWHCLMVNDIKKTRTNDKTHGILVLMDFESSSLAVWAMAKSTILTPISDSLQ
jgi:hypothetical protein